MYNRDYRDMIGGALIFAVGFIAAYIALTNMSMGDLHRIGPGMFPAMIGVLLALFGIAIFVPALSRKGSELPIRLRPTLAVSAAIGIFCITIKPLGIIPSVVILTVVCALGDAKSTPLATAINAVVLSLIASAIFNFGFNISAPIISLPW